MVDYRRSAVATDKPIVFIFVLDNDTGEELASCKADYVAAAAAGVAIIRKLRGRVVVPRLNGVLYYV
jgi:hypothetical protein